MRKMLDPGSRPGFGARRAPKLKMLRKLRLAKRCGPDPGAGVKLTGLRMPFAPAATVRARKFTPDLVRGRLSGTSGTRVTWIRGGLLPRIAPLALRGPQGRRPAGSLNASSGQAVGANASEQVRARPLRLRSRQAFDWPQNPGSESGAGRPFDGAQEG